MNAAVPFATQALPRDSSAVMEASAEPAAAHETVNPVDIVVAGTKVSESTILNLIRDAVQGGLLAVALATTSVAKIEGVLIGLLKLVTNGPSESAHPEEIQQRAETFVALIDDAVTDATVRGVNLIAGGTGGAVTTTKFTTMRGLDGSVVTVGGVGASAMNATAAGLGLAGFVASGRGAAMAFQAADDIHGAVEDLIVGGDNPTTITLQTINYGASTTETPQFPGRSWSFSFAPAGLPAASTETPQFDTAGNLRSLDEIATVPLSLNFTRNDAVSALASAMKDRGFEISIEQNGAGANVLRIAGNNIDVAAVSARNFNPGASSGNLDDAVDVNPDLSTLNSAFIAPDHTNLSGPLPLTEQHAPRVGIPVHGPEGTIANAETVENVGTVSAMTMRDIPASSDLTSNSRLPVMVASPWEGPDAAIATLTSAMRKAGTLGQILGGQIIVLEELRNSLPDETAMMVASESLYLGSSLAKSEATLAAARSQRELDGEPSDLSDHMSQLLLRFFHWRRDHVAREPDDTRAGDGRPTADDPQSPDDHGDRDEKIADEPFLEPGELDDRPA